MEAVSEVAARSAENMNTLESITGKQIDPAHRRKLKRAVKRHHNLVASRVKSRKGLGKRRYR